MKPIAGFRTMLAALCATATILAAATIAPAVANAGTAHASGTEHGSRTLRQGKPDRLRRGDDSRGRAGGVVRPQSVVAGKSIAEWTSEHVRWAVSFPIDRNPVFADETGELAYLGDVGGPVFFLGAGSDVTRRFDVPCGQYLLIPLLTQAWFLDETYDEATARAENSAFVDSIETLYASVDGRRVRDLFEHREASPEVFTATVPDGGVLGDVGGQVEVVADGYWLMLKPLPAGRHSIVVGGDSPTFEFGYQARFEIDVARGCRRHRDSNDD